MFVEDESLDDDYFEEEDDYDTNAQLYVSSLSLSLPNFYSYFNLMKLLLVKSSLRIIILWNKVGDGVGGGGISLAGTWWDKEALRIAEEVSLSFDGDLQIYAFKTTLNSTIQLRIDKLSNK